MTQDRVDSGSLLITHDFLATMLGTDRPSVSLAAGVLQRKKLIVKPGAKRRVKQALAQQRARKKMRKERRD